MDETTQILADEDMVTSSPLTTIVAEQPGPKDADGTDTQDADGTDTQDADGTDGKDGADTDGTDGADTDGTDAQA